jgi:hypothetical protein
MIPSRSMADDKAIKALVSFVGNDFTDRRHLALAALSNLVGVQQLLSDETRLEVSPSIRRELDSMLTETLTYIDIVLAHRREEK